MLLIFKVFINDSSIDAILKDLKTGSFSKLKMWLFVLGFFNERFQNNMKPYFTLSAVLQFQIWSKRYRSMTEFVLNPVSTKHCIFDEIICHRDTMFVKIRNSFSKGQTA